MKPESRFSKTQEMVYQMKVGEVMTRDVITVGPADRMSKLRGVLRSNRISGLPVTSGGRLVGLISLDDFITWLADRQEDCPIENRMTRKVETLFDDDPLVAAVSKFEKSGLGRFPVLRRGGEKLVGIVTKGDVIEGVLKKLEIDYQQEQTQRRPGGRLFEEIEADDKTLLLQYEVEGQDFKRAGAGSSRLKRTLSRLGLKPEVVRRVAIASYEAEMNLVIFTEGGRIRAQVQPAQVLLEVVDAGPGIADVEEVLQPGFSTAPDWVRELGFGAGMGLVNIRKSGDRFDIQSEPGKGTQLKVLFTTGNRADGTRGVPPTLEGFAADKGEEDATGRAGRGAGPAGAIRARPRRQPGHRGLRQRSA